jgi:hypothetical protein
MKWFSKAAVGGLLWLTFSAAAFGDSLKFNPESHDRGQLPATLSSDPTQTLASASAGYANDSDTRDADSHPPTGTETDSDAASGPITLSVSSSQNVLFTTPEPATLAMLSAGLLAIGLLRKRVKA